jgi:hypothetical protein
MLMSLAPLSFAFITHRNATGWFSAMFEPMIVMTSEFETSREKVVAAPRPKLTPRPGTLELCHMRA